MKAARAMVTGAVAAWTGRDGIVNFFAPDAQSEPRVGGTFNVHSDPLDKPDLTGADDMHVMAVQTKK